MSVTTVLSSTFARRALATLAALVVGAGSAATAADATTPTHQHVVRPLTASGALAAGYHLVIQNGSPVDCTFPESSPGAVDGNIRFCGPSAAYAIACWRAPKRGYVRCLRDATSHTVYRLPAAWAGKATHAPAHPSPLVITLADGERCSIRDGGAWESPKHHPRWVGTYSCNHGDDVVWGTPTRARTNGVDMSHATWTVLVGSVSGTWHVRAVTDAWFVGNHS